MNGRRILNRLMESRTDSNAGTGFYVYDVPTCD